MNALRGRSYDDISIRPFRVLEVDDEVDEVFGLIDMSDELGFDCVMLYPNDCGLYPPWDAATTPER